MFNDVNIKAVLPIHERLVRTGHRLQIKPNTPLATLVAAAMPATLLGEGTDLITTLKSAAEEISVPQKIEGTAGLESLETPTTTLDSHEDLLSTEVAAVGDLICRQVEAVRTKAKPVIGEIFALVEDTLGRERPLYWGLDIVRMHDIHSSAVLTSLIDTYKAHPAVQVDRVPFFPERTEEELVETIKTGNGSFDLLLADLISKHELNWVTKIYNAHFRTTGKYIGTANTLTVDESVVVFLLAKTFDDNPPENTNVNLVIYNNLVTGLMAQAAVQLHASYTQWNSFAKNGTLVLMWPRGNYFATPGDDQIRVHGVVYDEFIRRGGTPEVIVGSQVAARERYLEKLLEFKDSFARHYDRYVQQTVGRFNETIGERMRTVLLTEIQKKIVELPSEDRDPRFTSDQLMELSVRVLAIVSNDELVEQPYLMTRRIVSAILFNHIKADELLSRLDSLTTEFPNYSMMEVASLVVESLIIEYYRSQFDVVKTIF
jgi:hypothetical protein